MNNIIAFARLSLSIHLLSLQEQIRHIQGNWNNHFNMHCYQGEWKVISLRSPGGSETIIPDDTNHLDFTNTKIMDQCPAIKKFVELLGCPVMAVRLLNLRKGSEIKKHIDPELAFEMGEARLHIPIFTNDNVQFTVEGQRVKMNEGECWYINANLPHQVSNWGETDRLHLVIDCKVNDWLSNVFATAHKVYADSSLQGETMKKVIAELLLQNTPSSNQLAEELQNKMAML